MKTLRIKNKKKNIVRKKRNKSNTENEPEWEQGWRSGESARLSPMCPGLDFRTRRHMRAEFVGSLLCFERFFSGYSGFLLLFDLFD